MNHQCCSYCGEIQFTRFDHRHKEWCIWHPDYIAPVYGTCEVCKIVLNDCNWAYWIADKKLCREHCEVKDELKPN